MVRPHQPVPEVEIEAEVGAVGFVVLGVVGGSVEEEAERGAEEPGGEELVAAVAEDVEGNLPEHEDREGQRVDRQREDDERGDSGLDKGFPRAESIGRPGRRAERAVVRAVEKAEQPRVVHQPMRPIEIGIVDQDDDTDADQEPRPAVVADAEIHWRPAGDDGEDHKPADEAINGQAA